MTSEQFTLTLRTEICPHPEIRGQTGGGKGLDALLDDFLHRLQGYLKYSGLKAYAVFNTLTDIAARPPKNTHFQKNRDIIEKRSGRWLRDSASKFRTAGFDLNAWITVWDVSGTGSQLSGLN